jgi:hypothetical protein
MDFDKIIGQAEQPAKADKSAMGTIMQIDKIFRPIAGANNEF